MRAEQPREFVPAPFVTPPQCSTWKLSSSDAGESPRPRSRFALLSLPRFCVSLMQRLAPRVRSRADSGPPRRSSPCKALLPRPSHLTTRQHRVLEVTNCVTKTTHELQPAPTLHWSLAGATGMEKAKRGECTQPRPCGKLMSKTQARVPCCVGGRRTCAACVLWCVRAVRPCVCAVREDARRAPPRLAPRQTG